jgi:acetyl esterase/lipase
VQNFSGVLLDIMQRRNAAESLADRLTMGSLTAVAANVSADAAPAPDRAARRLAAAAASLPRPTHANVAYGPHQRQVLDFWQADTDHPAPLLIFIHGGGWNQGDKVPVSDVSRYLKEGISVVSINYRLVPQAAEAGVQPPIRWPLADAARALQFVRTMAREWNVDEDRIVASGNSAGACSSLWLAFRDDLADPDSPDPVARESTRLLGAAVINAQTSLDPWQMKEWTPNSRYGGHAFGFTGHAEGRTPFDRFIASRNDILHLIQEYSPYEWVSSGDPPVYLYYSRPPAFGEEQSDPTHTANFGVGLAVRLREAGVDFELVYPGVSGIRHATIPDFVIALLASESR